MTIKSLREQLQEINKLSDRLLETAEKLVDDSYRNTQSSSKHQDQVLLKRFKQVETLAHITPYMLKNDSKTYDIKDEDGITRTYKVKKIPTKHKGLVAFVLYSDDPENPRVNVVFRGTHSFSSASRNLETLGNKPGGLSFNRERQTIINNIKEIVAHKQAQSPNKVVLSIAGHSLGGGDAQNCATAVLSDIAENYNLQDNPLANVGTVNIMLANAVGVSSGSAKKAKNSLAALHRKDNPPKVNMFVCMVDGDPIQQAGFTTILADAPQDHINSYLLKADIGEHRKFANIALILKGRISIIEGLRGAYRAHTVLLFDPHTHKMTSKKADVSMRIYHNRIPGEDLIIKQQLENKLYRKFGRVFNPMRFLKYIVASLSFAKPKHRHKKSDPSHKSHR